MKKKEIGNKKKRFNPLHLLTWIAGGLSLLKIIEDLSPLTLFGKLLKWVDAYGLIVEKVGDFLFGWINFGWVSISNNEKHVLILAILIFTAEYHAGVQWLKNKGESAIEAYISSLISSFIFLFILILIPSLLLPSWGGLAGAIFGFLIICLVAFAGEGKDKDYSKRVEIFREMMGITVVLILLVALNYTVFS